MNELKLGAANSRLHSGQKSVPVHILNPTSSSLNFEKSDAKRSGTGFAQYQIVTRASSRCGEKKSKQEQANYQVQKVTPMHVLNTKSSFLNDDKSKGKQHTGETSTARQLDVSKRNEDKSSNTDLAESQTRLDSSLVETQPVQNVQTSVVTPNNVNVPNAGGPIYILSFGALPVAGNVPEQQQNSTIENGKNTTCATEDRDHYLRKWLDSFKQRANESESTTQHTSSMTRETTAPLSKFHLKALLHLSKKSSHFCFFSFRFKW